MPGYYDADWNWVETDEEPVYDEDVVDWTSNDAGKGTPWWETPVEEMPTYTTGDKVEYGDGYYEKQADGSWTWKSNDGTFVQPASEDASAIAEYGSGALISIGNLVNKIGKSAFTALKSTFTDPKTGNTDWRKVATLGGGLLGMLGSRGNQPEKTGYQGGIPTLAAVREQVPNTYDPNRRPGSGGQRYFTDVSYVAPADAAAARTAAQSTAQGLAALNAANPAREMIPPPEETPPPSGGEEDDRGRAPSEVIEDVPVPKYAVGGIAGLKKGRYLRGGTDGMADELDTTIEDKQPAKLSHGEFVIPADVVSHLGNGNSEAGAQRLYSMMDKIRKARTGTTKQGRQINPDKFIPT